MSRRATPWTPQAVVAWFGGEGESPVERFRFKDATYARGSDATAAVLDGRCDVVLFGGELSEGQLVVIDRVEVSTEDNHLGMAFMMDGADPHASCILAKLNEGLRVIRASGALQAAFDKYDPTYVGSDAPELTDSHHNDYCTVR